MPGKHSSVWDHIVWMYLRGPEQEPILWRMNRMARGGKMRYIRRIALSPLLRFAPARWRVRIGVAVIAAAMVAMAAGAVITFVAISGAALPAGLSMIAVAVWGGFVVITIGGVASDRAWREQERRAILLRQRRTRALRESDADALRRELDWRRSWWMQRLSVHPSHREWTRYRNTDRTAMVMSQLPLMLFFAVQVLPPLVLRGGTVPSVKPWMIMLFPISFIGGHLWIVRRQGRSRAGLIRAIKERACADCGYDLASLATGEAASDGGWVGPDRCPECGSPWPLVPPPVANNAILSDATELVKPLAHRDVGWMWRRWRAERRSARARE